MFILTLLITLLVSPEAVKHQTRETLGSMRNVSAVQSDGKTEYRVAVYQGQQATYGPPEKPYSKYRGITPGDLWRGMLVDSLFWELKLAGDHYTYKSLCRWRDTKHRWMRSDAVNEDIVPCEGDVYTSAATIIRITQRLHDFPKDRATRAASIQIDYGLVDLKTRKSFLPVRMIIDADLGGLERLELTWTKYREYYTEVVVKEIEEP